MTTAFAWSEVYETGFADVDVQHQRLVTMINQLTTQESVASAEVLDVLTDYAAQHFHDDEALMACSRLAPTAVAMHVAQHRAFVAEVQSMRHHRQRPGGDAALLGQLAGLSHPGHRPRHGGADPACRGRRRCPGPPRPALRRRTGAASAAGQPGR